MQYDDTVKSFPMSPRSLTVGLVLSLAVGLSSFLFIAQSIETDARERFSQHARNAQQTINERLKSYTDVLRGAASLLQSSPDVGRQQFNSYVKGLNLQRNFHGVVAINFGVRIRHDQLADFERKVRAEQAREWFGNHEFRMFPAGDRPEYCILTYIDGSPIATDAFGLDLLSVPYAAAVLSVSRDSGKLIASGQPISAASRPNNISLAMRVPIYRYGMPTSTVEQRRAAYIGSLGIAFAVPLLMQGIGEKMPFEGVRMTVIDLDGDGYGEMRNARPHTSRVLFDSLGTPQNPSPPLVDNDGHFSARMNIDYNGRPWIAIFSIPKRNMYTGYAEYFPWMALAAGFITSFLIWTLLQTLTSSRRHAINMAEDMTRELRESQAKLQLSHQNLRRLGAHAERIKERERKRIAREIHDDLGQNLLALRIEADMLSSRTGSRHPHLHSRALSTVAQIDATIRSVRQIINDLRPNVLDLGLTAAVEWQISEFRRRAGIACELVQEQSDIRVDDHCATALFRILQESLSNVVRHAHASFVRVTLRLEAGTLRMVVCDNGIGLPPGGRSKLGSFGLIGIEERIHILGGTFTVDSEPGKGTTISVTVPVASEPASANSMTAAPASSGAALV
jgi:signal transduction histidine kinase